MKNLIRSVCYIKLSMLGFNNKTRILEIEQIEVNRLRYYLTRIGTELKLLKFSIKSFLTMETK